MSDEHAPSETGWRGSCELWSQAAYEALIDSGIDAVKIMPLAQRLRLSRTSFYWFFKDRQALLAALRARWVAATTEALVASAAEPATSEAGAMLNVLGCFLSERFDQRLEFAVRGWALQDPVMMAALHQADALRLAALTTMLQRWGHSQPDADVRARTVYLVQIGYISMQTTEPLETRMQRVPHYVEIYTGTAPLALEIAQFRARLVAKGDMAPERGPACGPKVGRGSGPESG